MLAGVADARAACSDEREQREQDESRVKSAQHYGRGILPSALGQVNSKSKWLSRNGAETCNGKKGFNRARARLKKRDAVRRDPVRPA